MKTQICPTCGCSIVRLGIAKEKATAHGDHFFCCQACADGFSKDSSKYLERLKSIVVCPSCLAEKPKEWAVRREIAGEDVYFCGCPYCEDVYRKNPDYYNKRLEGTIPNKGVMDEGGNCTRPV